MEAKPCLTIAQCDVSETFLNSFFLQINVLLISNYSIIQDVISRTTLNTNVSEFVPRHLQSSPSRTTTLNVEVEEFHPRNYIPVIQSKSDDDASSKDIVTKQISPESRKVTIFHRAPTEKYTQPTPIKTSKDKPEKINVQISSAVDKSSTLISSISSRDKNDDSVNGVDNNKKIEKLVDPVNTKADLENKVVMHPKQQENILENVKKTKFKNNKFNKSSPRKLNNGHKNDVKVGKGTITNGRCDNVRAITKEQLEPKKNEVIEYEDNRNGGERIEKPSQPTYAQMVGPVSKPKMNIVKAEVVNPIQVAIEPLSAEELKSSKIIDEIKPVVKVETKWQTVRPKGKKKHFSATYEEPNDDWDDFNEENSVEVKETKVVAEKETEVVAEAIAQEIQLEEEIANVDETVESTPASKGKPLKTEKVKLKSKAKKNQKKIKELSKSDVTENEITKPNGSSTPNNDRTKSKSVSPIVDDLFVDEGNGFLNDIDISNFSFETDPSMFVNAITTSGIYTDNSMNGKSNTGFSLNNSLKLLNSFDFCKTKEKILLKEEEEMVIRVLKSLNETESQIVINDDINLNDSCEDVQIFNVVYGHNDTNNDKKNETNGAEIVVKCERNGFEVDQLKNDTRKTEILPTNGHQIEDTNIADSEQEIVDQNQKNPVDEPILNGNHSMIDPHLQNNGNGNEIDVDAQPEPLVMGLLIDDKNDLDVTKITDKIETEKSEVTTERILVEDEGINKDCTSNMKYDDEVHSDLSELSDENDETIVSQSNDYFEYDELETIKDIDVTELIDDLQFDDDVDDFIVGNEEEMNIRTDENELKPQENMIQEISLENEHLPQPSTNNIFIENEADISKTEITLNDIEENKGQDRIQSPRNSEDSGILEYHDDGRYFGESDNDKPEQISINSFPLTEAVSRWLEEKQKEKSPEPIIRLPADPQLSQRIEKSLQNRMHISQFLDDYEDDDTSDESETEFEVANHSKNLLSNPLRVLFPKKDTTTSNLNGIRKRVANHKIESDKSSFTVDEPDILEFWEKDPMLQSQNSNSTVLNEDNNCSIESDLEAYESVYGKTIDYAKLSANIHNEDVFLSNNIVSNDRLSELPNNSINNNTDSSLLHASSIKDKDDINSNDKNLNCFKPPEICCMLM